MVKPLPGSLQSNRSRRSTGGQGASRKQAPVQPSKVGFAWLNRILILAGGGVVLVAGLQAFVTLQSIPVEQITVTGKLEYTRAEEVQELVQPALVGGFLSADLTLIRQLLEDMPWIYRATVRRRWPSSLEINVVEQLPIARWGESGFLNHQAQFFQTINEGSWGALPLLVGPDGTARQLMGSYQRLEELLAPLRMEVIELSLDERGQLRAILQGGTEVYLGSDDFVERVQRLLALYRDELSARSTEVARVDLRYESGLAVAFHEPVEVAVVTTNPIRVGE
ncbi:MAG: cell division protein FtsQ/DivIB [Halioglobus sp.]